MHIINLSNITLDYGGLEVFSNLNWTIDHKACIGLIGPNGSGKSSILKIISGEISANSGTVHTITPDRTQPVRVGYLHQDVTLSSDHTVFDAAMVLPPALAEVEQTLAKIENQLSDPAIYNDMAKLERVLAKQEKMLEKYDRLGGHQHETLVKEILSHLGFTPEDYHLNTTALSGGQKKLVALTQLAAQNPDVLLLDEPDNHLDLTAKRNLERFIRQYDGAVIIVSHDRYLLDDVVTQIAELEDGKLTIYQGNYTAYTTERELRRLRQQQLYTAQQKEIAQIEAAIARFEHWARIVINERHIKQARHRRKMLDRMEANGEIIEAVRERKKMELELNGWRGSNKVLEINDLSMSFDDDLLFVDLNLLIRHGERVGLIGPNGAGKSVLFKLVLNELQPMDGEIKIGPSIKTGYYAQEHQTLDRWLERTPLELVRDTVPRSEGDAVAFLLKLLFTYDQVRQPIKLLSGGERSRLQLALLMLTQPNFLLLDEPTNNLDIASAEVLESVLDDFEGAMLIISHDRYFLDQVVDRIIVLDDGELSVFEGGYTDYLDTSG